MLVYVADHVLEVALGERCLVSPLGRLPTRGAQLRYVGAIFQVLGVYGCPISGMGSFCHGASSIRSPTRSVPLSALLASPAAAPHRAADRPAKAKGETERAGEAPRPSR